MKRFLLTIVFWLPLLLSAQEVQWANQIKNYSSDLGGKQYSVYQVLDKPNANLGEKSTNAWLPKNANSPYEYVRVMFEKPIRCQQVVVVENFNPGTIKQVALINHKGKMEKVYKGKPGPVEENGRMFKVTFPMTDYEVHGVQVDMVCSAVGGPNQIDAIGISSSTEEVELKVEVASDIRFPGEKENLGQLVNSQFEEVMPVISPDGKTLFFDRKNHPANMNGATADNDDIWFSTLNSQQEWGYANNIGPPLNNAGHNFVSSVTPDGNTLLLGNHYHEDGSGGSGVSITYRTTDGWSFPINQEIENYKNYDNYVEYCLSNDGKALLMAIQHDDSYGERDIYVSFRTAENKWSAPLNLGEEVNTSGGECTPFLAADGKTLYFGSNGRITFGSTDIFMTKRLDDTWQKWSEPVNLGPDLNTAGWDAYYTVPASGEYAYLVSNTNSLGSGDIFRIKLPEEVKPEPVVLITGKVLNAETNEPLAARIVYEELPGGAEVGIARSNPVTGAYKIVLPFGKNYGFLGVSEGYYAINENLDVTALEKYTEIKKDLYLAPIKVGQVVRLNNIFFAFASATLKEESYPELNRVITLMKESPQLEIQLGGHTDNVGSDANNLTLSKDRAKAVVDYLVENGVSSQRLSSEGFGESRPMATNETEEGRTLNRRVEFTIVKM